MQAVDLAVYIAEMAVKKVNELGSTAAMTQFQPVNSVAFLKAGGSNHDALPDCRRGPGHRAEDQVWRDPIGGCGNGDCVFQQPTSSKRYFTYPYWMKELTYQQNEEFKAALKELAALCSKRNAKLLFPKDNILRITIDGVSLEVSFLPDQPVTTTSMLRKAMRLFE